MTGITTTEKRALRQFKKGLLDTFGDRVVSVHLFGSKARGDATEESDTDVLVILHDALWQDRRTVNHLSVDVMLETGVLLSAKTFTPKQMAEMQHNRAMFWQSIEPDLIRL